MAAETMTAETTNSSKLQDLIVEKAQSFFVKHGDMTPFEVLNHTKNDSSETAYKEMNIDQFKRVCFIFTF